MYTKRRFTTIIYNYNYIYSSKVFHTRSKARKATDYPITLEAFSGKRFHVSSKASNGFKKSAEESLFTS